MNSSRVETLAPLTDSELRALLLQYRQENWKGIQPPEIQERIVEGLIHDDVDGILGPIAEHANISEKSRILDLGSGVGSFVVSCRRRGFRAFGVEPDRIGQGAQISAIQIARRRLVEAVFVSGVGEALPFADSCFDLVVMNQVIEHVSDQTRVIAEAARVVRTGGVIYVACPNYLRFYEPHYKIFWLPLMPEVLGRMYLRMRGRSPAMLSQLTYTTNRRLRRLFAPLGGEYQVVDLHRQQFLKKRGAGSFAARSTRLVSRITKLPIVGLMALRGVLWYASLVEGGCEMLIIRTPKATAKC
ncbi:MAG TPA: class I SAM-dependent methyltransferase [Candidatus Sulfotelmatobacter sp.]